MFRSILILLLAATSTYAGEPAIQSSEQAELRLRQVCDTGWKGSFRSLSKAHPLSVRRTPAKDFQPPAQDPVFADTDPARFFGSFAAVVGSKSDTWVLTYDLGSEVGGVAFYLAADTGKLLYAHYIPEG